MRVMAPAVVKCPEEAVRCSVCKSTVKYNKIPEKGRLSLTAN